MESQDIVAQFNPLTVQESEQQLKRVEPDRVNTVSADYMVRISDLKDEG